MGIVRMSAGIAGMPLAALWSAYHRLRCGPVAVLDVDVRASPGAAERQAFLNRLRRAGHDPCIAAVLLRLYEPPGGWAACQDLRATIRALRRSGTKVYAWAEAPGNALMWVASAADRVFVVPTSELGVVGVGVELTFFGAALARFGIEPDFEAAGAYKAFGEPFTRSFASPANQEATGALVSDLHRQLVEGIADGRALDAEVVEELLAAAPLSATQAQEAGLVDQLAYDDELEAWIERTHGDRVRTLSFATWSRRDRWLEWIEGWGDGGAVLTVLHLEGPIVLDDKGPRPMIRARKLAPLLRRLRKDEDVGAVVLHVNSPGGSALASDLLWREIDELRKHKPVVAAFEDVAASGGYYLAAPAAEILARPASLTGSIGVFGGKLVVASALRQVGVHTQDIAAAPNALMYSPSRPFTDGQRVRFRASLQRFYDGFVQRVATGRRRSEDALEPHCRGRVWTGRAARDRGLVDRHGDLNDAVERARLLAGLHVGAYRRRDLAFRPQTLAARLLRNALRQGAPAGALELAGGLLGLVRRPGLDIILSHPSEPLAMLPFDIEPR